MKTTIHQATQKTKSDSVQPVSQYEGWKKRQGQKIYLKASRTHAPAIIMMLLDGVKELYMIEYIKKELKLRNPEKVLSDCRAWAMAPDPYQIHVQDTKAKDAVLERLTKLWQRKLNVPYSEELLALWMPQKTINYHYERIEEVEAEKMESEENPAVEADPEEKPPSDPYRDCVFGASQKKAMEELESAYHVSQLAKTMNLPIEPRTNCLMVAPSGSGKTFLAKAFASRLGVPFISVNVSSWMPMGSRVSTQNSTLAQLATFVAENDKGIIYLDELDKLNIKNSWNQHLRLEIHNLLDRQIGVEVLDGLQRRHKKEVPVEELKKLNENLKHNFFIIAGGTWQEFWENQTSKTVGFNSQDTVKALNKNELIKQITPELLQRFNQELIVMPPLVKDDYLNLGAEMVAQISKSKTGDVKEVVRNFIVAVNDGVDHAVSNKTGMRFLEECVTKALQSNQ